MCGIFSWVKYREMLLAHFDYERVNSRTQTLCYEEMIEQSPSREHVWRELLLAFELKISDSQLREIWSKVSPANISERLMHNKHKNKKIKSAGRLNYRELLPGETVILNRMDNFYRTLEDSFQSSCHMARSEYHIMHSLTNR